jgi:hypothetical protein
LRGSSSAGVPLRLRAVRTFRVSAVLLAAATCVLCFPGIAAALTPPIDVLASKQADGPYRDETQSATVPEGKTKLFFWKVAHPEGSGFDGNYSFDDASTYEGTAYRVNWYRGREVKPSRKISQRVEGGGYEFRVREGKVKYFTATVRVVNDNPTLCLVGQGTDLDAPYSDAAAFSVNGNCL